MSWEGWAAPNLKIVYREMIVKSYWLLLLMIMTYAGNGYTTSTHIQHIINNETPFEFYYVVVPASEVPIAFSCSCEGLIGPGEKRECDCYSQLESMERRYRMEYMKNTSPTYRLSVTHSVESDAIITWQLSYDSYWDWLNVQAKHTKLE